MDFEKVTRDIATAIARDCSMGCAAPKPATLAFIKQQLLDAFSEGKGPDRTPGKVTTSDENGVRVTVCQ